MEPNIPRVGQTNKSITIPRMLGNNTKKLCFGSATGHSNPRNSKQSQPVSLREEYKNSNTNKAQNTAKPQINFIDSDFDHEA